MDQWHVTLSSTHHKALFPSEQAMRAAVRTIDAVAGEHVLMFCLVDDHGHVWIVVPGELIELWAGALRRALEPIAAVPIDIVYSKPVATRTHQRNMVDYLLDQLSHHRIEASPALWTGGCYQDLIGARRLDRFRPRLKQLLPRLRRDEIDRAVRLAPGELRDATGDQVRRAGALGLADAALAAVAAGPEVVGRPRHVTRARRAACHLATAVGIRTVDVADALELTPRTVRRLCSEPADDALIAAVRLQIALAQLPLAWAKRAGAG